MTTLRLDAHDARPAAAAMLAAGALLPLAPDGFGVPCPLRALTGVPCPLCGMTTSVEAAVHLDIAAALAANPAGVAAVALALLVLARGTVVVRVPLALVLAVVGLLWVYELERFSVL